MAITYEDVGESLRRISLSGRLDGAGTEEVSAELEALATTGSRRVVVDLTRISFLASVGIRAVLGSAKASQRNGGRMVLLVGTNPFVTKTLEATGIDTLIPMFVDAADAEKAVLD
jgi:anti-sigma B factor antagonist